MHPHAWKVFLYTIMTTRSDTNNKHDNLNSDGHGTKPAFHKVHGATESQSANEIASGKRWLEELMKVKKIVAETAQLKEELNLKRRGSTFILCLSLLIFAISCSTGYFIHQYTYHQDV